MDPVKSQYQHIHGCSNHARRSIPTLQKASNPMKTTPVTIKRNLLLLAAMFVLLAATTKVWAASFTVASSGVWNLGATWGNSGNNVAGSGYPGSADTAIIATAKSVTGLEARHRPALR